MKGARMMKIIHNIYQFVVGMQIIAFFIFLAYFFDEGLDLTIPVNFVFSNEIGFTFDLKLNYLSIFGFIAALSILYLLSSVTVLSTGMNDSGSHTIKKIISFISLFALLMIPVTFLFANSIILSVYLSNTTLFILIIYLLNFLGGADE